MTIDDESSVYVGGLPYDASEDSVRRVFELYGQVVAVKIVNDSTTRGKCYGFVTFRNPRSAIDAMNDMDGRTVDGRVVRVNEVRSRGGRSGFGGERGRGRGRGDRGEGGRESFRRDVERGRSWRSRGREDEIDYDDDNDRERYMERGDRYIVRSRDREYEEERDGGYVRGGVESEMVSGSFADRDRERRRELEDVEQGSSRSGEKKRWGKRNRTVESDRDGEVERSETRNDTVEKDRDHHSRRWNSSNSVDRNSREVLSHSSDGFNDPVKDHLEKTTRKLEELKKETSGMEEKLEDDRKLVLNLQKQSKKLEDALVHAMKNTLQQKTQLTKMLVETATVENCIDDVGLRDTLMTIANA